LSFWTGCCQCNIYFLFFELFEAVDMDGSFSMRRYTSHLDSWFKSYEVFKISAQVWACSATVNATEFAQNYPKFAKICPKTISLRTFEMPPKIEI
jgi:hypothetical protein